MDEQHLQKVEEAARVHGRAMCMRHNARGATTWTYELRRKAHGVQLVVLSGNKLLGEEMFLWDPVSQQPYRLGGPMPSLRPS